MLNFDLIHFFFKYLIPLECSELSLKKFLFFFYTIDCQTFLTNLSDDSSVLSTDLFIFSKYF